MCFFFISESSLYTFFALFFHCLFSFRSDRFLNRCRTFFLQQQHLFKDQIFFVLSFYISFVLWFRHRMFHSKITHSCFHRKKIYFDSILSFLFFVKVFSFNFFFCRFNFLFSFSFVVLMFKILCRSMFSFCFRTLLFWSKTFEFNVLLCCRLFEKKIVSFCFCLSRTLFCFDILSVFAHSKDSFFDVYEKIFSSIINVKKWNICSKKLMINRK